MKAYDYGFLGAIAATLLVSVGGIVWLSLGSIPTRSVVVASAEASWTSEPEPAVASPAPSSQPLWTRLRVHGVVTDPNGAALAGVRVRPEGALAPETLTDPSGLYELLLPLEQSRPALRFLADGYEDRHMVLEQRGPATRIDVCLEPRRDRTIVSGRVSGRGGEAVPGELVELESDQLETIHTARTDASGRFFIADVAVADDYELRIRPEGSYRQLWQFPLRATRNGLDLDLVLEPVRQSRPPTSTAFNLRASARP